VRRLPAVCILCLLFFTSLGQRYGNEWIRYNQQYHKIPIYKEGLYRIDSATLSKYYDLTTINPKNFQLFLRGMEQYLFINGEADGKINTGDYIEFYANAHMNQPDSMIYAGIKYHPNPYAGMFNDTICVFLTLNNSTGNKRYTLETDTASASYPPAQYFYTEKIYQNPISKNFGALYLNLVSDPRYRQEEGRGDGLNKGDSIKTNFPPLNTYTNSPALPFYLTANFSGASVSQNAFPDHQSVLRYFDPNGSVTLLDTTYQGYGAAHRNFILNPQNFGSNGNFVFKSAATPTLAGIQNSTVFHYLRLFYPQTLNLNFTPIYNIATDYNSGKKFYNFFNFNYGASPSVPLYDLVNGKKITTVLNSQFIRAVIPAGPAMARLFMAAENVINPVSTLIKVNGTGSFTNFKNSANAKNYVIVYHESLKSGALSYGNYRQSVAGGSYQMVMANIQELYEQFAYGVNKHPISIRNFMRFLKDSLPTAPSFVLLIGKGLNQSDIAGSTYTNILIPAMGVPSSDNLFVTNLDPANDSIPEIPLGRLAATTNSQITDYLQKVQQHESDGPADWKKRVLHFVGGENLNELSTFSSYMDGYEKTIEDTLFGAEVLTFKKNTTSPIQTTISDSIRTVINNGSAILNFFGHGSTQGFDQSVDDPEFYENKGKYPFVIANSCYSGNIHIEGLRSVSERMVFAKEKGSIGFIATTSYGFDYSLDDYTKYFYRALSATRYGQSLGAIITEAIRKNSQSSDLPTTFVGLDMTLHGDPAIVISNGVLPDYQINNNDVSFDLKKYADSLGIQVRMKNTGKAIADSITVRIERSLPGGDSTMILKNIRPPYFKDSLKIFTPIDFDHGIGLNRFRVFLDYFDRTRESSETNNSTNGTVDLFIPGGDLLPVYPYRYSIVPDSPTLILKASTTDPFAPQFSYRLQLDTNRFFKTPIAGTVIASKGGVIEWNVNLTLPDSTVYFWRVSRDSTGPTNGFNWKESSFQTIGVKRGWGQAHFHQFRNDKFQFVTYNEAQRNFVFQNEVHTIYCRDGIYPYIGDLGINYYFDEIQMSNWSCAPNGFNFAVFDSISASPLKAKSLTFPSPGVGNDSACICVNRLLDFYSYGASSNPACGVVDWKKNMEKFLNDVNPNQYVLAWTVGATNATYAEISSYSNSLYNAFESIGAKTIRTTSDSVPYILFGRKGMSAGQGHEVKGVNRRSVIYLTDTIRTKWKNGFVASEIIGPSFKWNSLHWNVKSIDATPGDTTILKVVGIKKNGQVDTLQTFPTDSTNVYDLANYADADIYPYLQLVALMKDNLHRTSPQLKRWQVLYEEAPECAINPLKGFSSVNDTLQEGDEVSFRFPIENIGVKDFNDSLVISYWLEDAQRNKVLLPDRMKRKPFKAGELIVDTVKINSYQLRGSNTLWIYVNQVQNPRYQLEQYQFNNVARYPFSVKGDITNPLLDVTFDGIRILNGDIVSARPEIFITLKDENKFLALNDTSAFLVSILAPGQGNPQRIYFANGLQFTPASLPKNSASIRYNAVFPADGRYMLIVQAKDRSANASGANDYRIQFEIENKPSVTQVLNYPNPFSTSTKFVFTLTGSEIPEVFTIQIMTISGKIVREITRSELGYLHIGRNVTEYAWDGKDSYGDRLGNGVYLYRVITRLNGEKIEKNNTSADKYFVKDFGKMVLIR
jgi:hypothetical protein